MSMIVHEELKDLPAKVYSLFDPKTAHDYSKDNLEALGENVKEIVARRLTEIRDPTEKKVLRFSSLGKPDRQLWYEANKPELADEMAPKTYLKFLYGDVIEQLMLFLMKEAGYKIENEQLEVELDGVKGHLDATADGITVDVKSASPQGYIKFANGTLKENDSFGYIGQISSYGNVVTPEKGAAFVAFDKVHGDVCVSGLGREGIAEFDTKGRIAHLKEVIANENKPEKCYEDVEDGKSGNRKLSTQCSYCAYKFDCWAESNDGKGLRTFIYSNGPRYLTKVERLPDVREKGVTVDPKSETIIPF